MTTAAGDLVTRLYDDVFNGRRIDRLDELIADQFVEHALAPFGTTAPGAVDGPSHMRAVVEWLTAQFPDVEFSTLALVCDGDLVAIRVRAAGTSLGPFNGVIPPTGRRFSAEQSHWYRCVDGRLTEHWATRDDLTAMLQLGVIRPPGGPPTSPEPTRPSS